MKKFVALLVAILSAAPLHLQAQTTLPNVEVRAPTTSGGNVVCRGQACASLIASMQAQINEENLVMNLPMEEDPPISKVQFCANLKASKPANCSYSNPPSTPSFDPNWTPNGCGNGSLGAAYVNVIVASGYPITGGTGLDQPAYDVNFQSACNAHDFCYGMEGGKSQCDSDFSADMAKVCLASSNFACSAIRVTYYSAVQNFGQDEYNSSAQENVCAAWSSNMRNNGCSP